MTRNSVAKIISWNVDNEAVCASAAKMSTTKGNANEIFEKSRNNPQNTDLIKKVLRSGHKSVIEHAVFSIAFWDVSAFVEQFLIECRLASFTVKSRRYVDFSSLGYIIPSDLCGESLMHYREYMDLLFGGYKVLLEMGIPKEDARFLLPYSFCSNFYCTLNARELANLISSIKYGRGKNIPELQNLAQQLIEQISDIFPALLPEFDCESKNTVESYNDLFEVWKKNIPDTYLLFQDLDQKLYYISDSSYMPSQLFRKCLAPYLGANYWDWRSESYSNNILETISLFKGIIE